MGHVGHAAVIGRTEIVRVLEEQSSSIGIISAEKLTDAEDESCVLVLGKDAVINAERMSIFAAVVNADEDFPADALKGIPVITCGMGRCNTVSVTSRTSEMITVSLNRTISSMSGVCEPQELPLPLISGADEYDHMAAFALLLLLGRL